MTMRRRRPRRRMNYYASKGMKWAERAELRRTARVSGIGDEIALLRMESSVPPCPFFSATYLAWFAWWLLSGAAVRGAYYILNPRAYDARTSPAGWP